MAARLVGAVVLLAAALAFAASASAAPKGKGGGKSPVWAGSGSLAQISAKGRQNTTSDTTLQRDRCGDSRTIRVVCDGDADRVVVAGDENVVGTDVFRGLPPGLGKRRVLPYGLAKRETLPPGLAKGHGVPPGLANRQYLPPGLSK